MIVRPLPTSIHSNTARTASLDSSWENAEVSINSERVILEIIY